MHSDLFIIYITFIQIYTLIDTIIDSIIDTIIDTIKDSNIDSNRAIIGNDPHATELIRGSSHASRVARPDGAGVNIRYRGPGARGDESPRVYSVHASIDARARTTARAGRRVRRAAVPWQRGIERSLL